MASWQQPAADRPIKLRECAEQGTNLAVGEYCLILACKPLYMPDIFEVIVVRLPATILDPNV